LKSKENIWLREADKYYVSVCIEEEEMVSATISQV